MSAGACSLAAAALLALSCAAEGGDLRLTVAALPAGARAEAFDAAGTRVEAARRGDAFVWPELAAGAWNIEIEAGGRRVIGVDMRVPAAEGVPRATTPMSESAAAPIVEFFKHSEGFFPRRRMPLAASAGDRAVALVEGVREGATTTFGGARGKLIFRLDLWDFERSFGAWRKTGERAFLRRMIDAGDFDAESIVYAADLGGIEIAPGEDRTVEYEFPSPDASVEGGKPGDGQEEKR